MSQNHLDALLEFAAENEGLVTLVGSRRLSSVPSADIARSGNLRFAREAAVQGWRDGYITESESRRLTDELERLARCA
jgi:hypothetical protein